MQINRALVRVILVVAVMLPLTLVAQTSSINAFSPYTMYGIGEVNTPGTITMRSMGGAGVAMRGAGIVNMLNPAAFSAAAPKSFLFNYGMEGQNFYNSQTVSGENKNTSYNTFNFHDISFQVPVTKNMGLGFSLSPYSSVGYRISHIADYSPTDPVWGNVGQIQYNYQGEGDVTEVKLGAGWEVAKNFSIGAAAIYYWGRIDRNFTMTPISVVGSGTYIPTYGLDRYDISSIKWQLGLQWSPIFTNKRILTIGATYDFGGDLKPEHNGEISIGDLLGSVVEQNNDYLDLVLPQQFNVGLHYQTNNLMAAIDYTFQDWGDSNNVSQNTGLNEGAGETFRVQYINTSTIKMGVEYTPNRYNVRNPLSRWSYRVGYRYGNYNQSYDGHKIAQHAITAGVGVPVKLWAISAIDVGFEYGRRGYNIAESVGLVQQQYFKFSLGFKLFAGAENGEYWFMRPKYD